MPLNPTEVELLTAAVESGLLDVHTGMPGIVESYDASAQTCDVKPAIKRVIKNPGEARLVESIPIVQNVRVQWPSAGGFWITLPLRKGDYVWLTFSEASDDKFRATGQESEPDDLKRHALGDASCYPIPGPDANKCADASATNMILGKDGGAIITIGEDGDIKIGRGAVEKIARADRVDTELAKLQAAHDSHVHITTATVGATATPGVIAVTAAPVGALSPTGADKGYVE